MNRKFSAAAEQLIKFSNKLCTFEKVPTYAFKKLYGVREKIEHDIALMNSQVKKIDIQQKELNDAKDVLSKKDSTKQDFKN